MKMMGENFSAGYFSMSDFLIKFAVDIKSCSLSGSLLHCSSYKVKNE